MAKGYFAHPTAIIDAGSNIADGARIWHFCHVMAGASIGDDSSLGQNVFVAKGVSLGRNVKVQNNVSIYEGVVIEDDVFLGPSMVFTNVKNPRSAISRKNAYEKTIVRRGATIGANATIVCGIEIGKFAFIGAGAVVTKKVPNYAMMLGNPAKHSGWMSEAGHRLEFENGVATCKETGDTYQMKNDEVWKLDRR